MSDERNYYCLCEDNCRFPTMTREQILTAIAQAIETGKVVDPSAGFITKVKETNSGAYITFWVGTRKAYNALGKIEKNCIYIITDDTSAGDLAATVKQLHDDFETLAVEVGKKAPAGLVTTKNKLVESWDDINALIDEAVLKMEASTIEIISFMDAFLVYSGGYITIHKGRNEDNVPVVDVEMELEGMRFYRHGYSEGADAYIWDEWEHENPQLREFATYRTTERYKGKPVYVQLADLGALPASGSKSFSIGTEKAEIVSVNAIVSKADGSVVQHLPFFSDSGQVLAFVTLTDVNEYGTGNIVVTTDMSQYNAVCVVKYIEL